MKNMCSYESCENASFTKGLCGGHYQQSRAGRKLTPLRKRVLGDVLYRLTSRIAEEEKLDPNSCWNWIGHLTYDGYGQIRVAGATKLSHRVMYSQTYHKDITGLQIDHICHNRKCINPRHLRLATPKENAENASGATKRSKTGVRGVFLTPSGKYKVRVVHNYKSYGGGTFSTLEEAKFAAVALRNELFTYNIES